MKPADTKLEPLPRIGPADRLGAVLPVAAAPTLDGADLTNVIVLSHRRHLSDVEAPAISVNDKERPAPAPAWHERTPWTALVAAVLLLHLVLVLVFMRDPAPMPSLALDSISVDIVLGGQTAAGLAQAPSPDESAPSAPSDSAPQKPTVTETPTETTEQTRPQLRPRIEPQANEPPREEPKREDSQTAAAEPDPAPAATEPAPAPVVAEKEPTTEQAEPEKPKPVEEPVASQPPPPKQEPTEKPRDNKKPSPPRVAAAQSGVGIGSSRTTQEWASLVSGHLARHKRYPQEALSRGIGGTASVAFSLDGNGRVLSVRLVRSSGNASLDRESQDLVRRAAPFPVPPQGRASITVPVNYNVRTGR